MVPGGGEQKLKTAEDRLQALETELKVRGRERTSLTRICGCRSDTLCGCGAAVGQGGC